MNLSTRSSGAAGAAPAENDLSVLLETAARRPKECYLGVLAAAGGYTGAVEHRLPLKNGQPHQRISLTYVLSDGTTDVRTWECKRTTQERTFYAIVHDSAYISA